MSKPYKLMTEEEKSAFNRYCVERWQKRKLDAIAYKGGHCESCGYDKCPEALEFHHLDPSEKEANWNKIRLWSWKKCTQELDKCALLCSNCHREEHARLLSSAG